MAAPVHREALQRRLRGGGSVAFSATPQNVTPDELRLARVPPADEAARAAW
jgi:hypothetical protein